MRGSGECISKHGVGVTHGNTMIDAIGPAPELSIQQHIVDKDMRLKIVDTVVSRSGRVSQ